MSFAIQLNAGTSHRHSVSRPRFQGIPDNFPILTDPHTKALLTPPITYMFREGETLSGVLGLVGNKPAHFYSMGCSNGEELWSLKMLAMQALGEKNADKNYSFTGYDRHQAMLHMAMMGLVALHPNEVKTIKGLSSSYVQPISGVPQAVTDIRYSFPEFPEQIKDKNNVVYQWHQVSPAITKGVKFEPKDLIAALESITPKPGQTQVFFIRNIWTYLQKDGKVDATLDKLDNIAQPGDLLCTGELDGAQGMNDIRSGFDRMTPATIREQPMFKQFAGLPDHVLQGLIDRAKNAASASGHLDAVTLDLPPLLQKHRWEKVPQAELTKSGSEVAYGKIWRRK